MARRCASDLGIVGAAKIAQAWAGGTRYSPDMDPQARPRRTTRATYVGHGIVVGRIENEWRLFRGMKDNYAFVVPGCGTWEFLYRGGTYSQGPGVLQLKQPGELLRELRRDGPASYDIVVFDNQVLAAAGMASSTARELVFDIPQLVANDPRAAPLLSLLGWARQATAGAAEPLAVENAIAEAALVLASLGAPQRAVGREARAVRRAREYLQDRMTGQVRLDDLADHVRLDKFHLVRAFRDQVGAPPYAYLTHARVHRARELLRAGLPAGRVALEVGYCDQSQLHRHFVRIVGTTPGAYAASARSAPSSVALGACAPMR